MRAGKPLEAISIMEPSRQVNGQGADGFYLRGKAYLQANQLPQAEAEFRNLLAHPEIEATAYQLPMSQLQLARALARENRIAAAIEAYRAFLDLWAHADTSQPTLIQAKSELALLSMPPK
jgi:tetratricopeptide (TPR) repeat protein